MVKKSLSSLSDNIKFSTQAEESKSDILFKPTSMRILYLAANPQQLPCLDLEEELRELNIELRGVRHRGAVKLNTVYATRPDDLVRYVREYNPNIIHFSGHGSEAGIVLRTESGQNINIDGRRLQQFLSKRGVDLVVLNSCYSQAQAEIIGDAVSAVVGITDAIDDEAARRFSIAFYRSLGEGLTIRDAFRDAVDSTILSGFPDIFFQTGQLDLTFVS
ncbi:MAG: CHAT domain-containing protein [Methyloligellaceae bacterium]